VDDVRSMSEREDSPAGEVLSSLPAKRPQRRSQKRGSAPRKRRAATKPPAARRAASGAPRKRAGRRPAGVRPSAATRAASSTPTARPGQPPEGLELFGTAVHAAGELAQLGLVLGTKALRGAVSRLPRP
jgi:hypothetical protein